MDDEAAPRTATILERLRQGEYDCLVCEYELPGTDGIELLEEVDTRRGIDPSEPSVSRRFRRSEFSIRPGTGAGSLSRISSSRPRHARA
ncbi:hypothetical protein [Natronococcus sp. A-GB7]|uniref:hypothetical protein n=1 Tax=Natronococcus sp. A-GB7 TaxID=3037649 RepID=UPI00241E5B33|nr:hypothetical protein [Natronococcus sp. A-GB7]MDG5819593.1 hypothetical protein [Natronococcus sp. A-GB7]